MKYSADLHIHTVLSPCGDLYMSPSLIVEKAIQKNINIIGISDHNSTKNCLTTKQIAAQHNILVVCGAEICSKEEVHCLCFVPDNKLDLLQSYIDSHIGERLNDSNYFGEQLIVNQQEQIVGEENKLLIQSIGQSVYQIQNEVEKMGGIFIPAHIDAHRNSIGSQLGFIPLDLKFDALEIRYKNDLPITEKTLHIPVGSKIIENSDAHYLDDIGRRTNLFELGDLSFESLKAFFEK